MATEKCYTCGMNMKRGNCAGCGSRPEGCTCKTMKAKGKPAK